MKTYITPNTEYMAIVKSGILCGSSDTVPGSGLLDTNPTKPDNGGTDAPRRRVF